MNGRDFADLLTPGFRVIFDDKYKEVPMKMNQLFNVETSTKADEKDSGISGFGLAEETNIGAPIAYEDPVQDYDSTYSHLKYSKGFKMPVEMYDDDLYGIMRKKPGALGKCMRRTAEDLASKVFNRAFDTAYDGPDGVPLVSTVHPREDGGTSQSNASSNSITLSETNLETALIAFRKQLDEKGQKIDTYPTKLVIPVDLAKTAHLIVDSPQRQGTADNDANPYKGKFEIIDWLYLTSTTAWFLIDPSEAQLNWFWRKQASFKNDELFDTEYAVYKSTMRLSRGWSGWRGFWGSQGNTAAYTGV